MSRLSRWSQRKRADAMANEREPGRRDPVESVGEEAAMAPDGAPPTGTAELDASSPEPGSLDHTLPDPDTLPPGSDIKAFLAPGVSAGLRRRALRRLFAADHYGIRDGLDDYDEDYRRHLRPLAGELAQRLRQWARQDTGEDETGTGEWEAGRHESVDAAGTTEVTDDANGAPDRSASTRQATLDEGCSGENAKSDQH